MVENGGDALAYAATSIAEYAASVGAEPLAGFLFGFKVGWFLAKSTFGSIRTPADTSNIHLISIAKQVQIPLIDGNTPVLTAWNNILNLEGLIITDARSVRIALGKMEGARQQGNETAYNLQQQAMDSAITRLQTDKQQLIAALQHAMLQMVGSQFMNISVTRDEVLALRNKIMHDNALPPREVEIAKILNVTSEENKMMIHLINGVTGETLPNKIDIMFTLQSFIQILKNSTHEQFLPPWTMYHLQSLGSTPEQKSKI